MVEQGASLLILDWFQHVGNSEVFLHLSETAFIFYSSYIYIYIKMSSDEEELEYKKQFQKNF
jgi:hypothetical protein